MSKWMFLLVTLAFACGKKQEGENKAGATAAKPDEPSANGTTVAPVAPSGDLTCAKVVAAAVRDKYLAGFTLEEPASHPTSINCSFKKAAATVNVKIVCRDSMKGTMQAVIDGMKQSGLKFEEVPSLGRLAFRSDGVVQFWDDAINCHVTVAAFDTDLAKNPVGLAKDLAASLTPASLK